ncbi:hypothetical protein Taro_011273 [Colocasia esculenta]|uniref:Uncharacterized protein n=1 Tax=Colocasia esculenta TaxID=4460 RepID=A0A843UC60_COLES|nr:hypothetical protein [Colocasia esculenta]
MESEPKEIEIFINDVDAEEVENSSGDESVSIEKFELNLEDSATQCCLESLFSSRYKDFCPNVTIIIKVLVVGKEVEGNHTKSSAWRDDKRSGYGYKMSIIASTNRSKLKTIHRMGPKTLVAHQHDQAGTSECDVANESSTSGTTTTSVLVPVPTHDKALIDSENCVLVYNVISLPSSEPSAIEADFTTIHANFVGSENVEAKKADGVKTRSSLRRSASVNTPQ